MILDKIRNSIPEEITNFFIKIILVACVTMSIKIAIQMKKEKVSLLNIILSFVIGVGFAAITGGIVMEKFSPSWVPVVIAVIVITAEKVGNYLIYKLKVDELIEDLIKYLVRKNKK